MAREIGLTCWQRCGSTFSFVVPKGMAATDASNQMEQAADKAGWVIGHFDGQGNFACPDCRNTVWNPIPLNQQRAR